jgi:hypothetical protein
MAGVAAAILIECILSGRILGNGIANSVAA